MRSKILDRFFLVIPNESRATRDDLFFNFEFCMLNFALSSCHPERIAEGSTAFPKESTAEHSLR